MFGVPGLTPAEYEHQVQLLPFDFNSLRKEKREYFVIKFTNFPPNTNFPGNKFSEI